MGLINTRLNTSTAITAGSIIPLGTTIHKCGCDLNSTGNAITIKGSGYYKIIANVTVAPAGATEITANLFENGTIIASSSAVPTAIANAVNLTLVAIVYNRCKCDSDLITIGLDSAGSVTEMDVVAEAL